MSNGARRSCLTKKPDKKSRNTIFLKGLCHEIENGYNWYQKTDKKNLVLPEHIFNYFQHIFMF
jgi:hypothetical protein